MIFQERTYSVLLVSSSESFNKATMPLFPVTDYYPVTVVKNVAEARRRLLANRYDIVLVNTPLPDDFGKDLAIDVCGSSDAGVLLLVKNELYNDVYAKVVQHGVMTLSKPTSTQLFSETLRGLCATRERLRRREEKQKSVEEKMDEMRRINRAKWHLIESRSMTEPEAHRFIEKQSMDLRLSKRDISDKILIDEL